MWYERARRQRPGELSNVEFLGGLYETMSKHKKATECLERMVRENFTADYAHRKLASESGFSAFCGASHTVKELLSGAD